jgi:hypothetical protein
MHLVHSGWRFARLQRATLFGLALLAGVASPGVALAQGCLQPGVAEEQTRLWLLEKVTLSSPGQPAMYELHATDSSQVYWVTDSSSCRRASVAVASHFAAHTLTPPAVYLLRLGPTRFMAWNSVRRLYFAMDEDFRYVTLIARGGYPD